MIPPAAGRSPSSNHPGTRLLKAQEKNATQTPSSGAQGETEKGASMAMEKPSEEDRKDRSQAPPPPPSLPGEDVPSPNT
ncbi:UNVERIFIED_CONTAM: hypothetical protein K2H54_022170 [Gekko kuhli]